MLNTYNVFHSLRPSHAYTKPTSVQIMACRQFDAKPLPIPMVSYFHFGPLDESQQRIRVRMNAFTLPNQLAQTILDNVTPSQYDAIKWKHFPCYWPFVRGIHRLQRPVRWSFDIFFVLRRSKRLSKQSRRG